MTNSNRDVVVSVAKETNVSTEGSKLDIIFGGWLTFNCIHGICYYVKFLNRSESPRDYVDGLLSMKHLPNVTIIDMAHILAKHGNNGNRANDVKASGLGNENNHLFYPFDGRLGDENDLQDAKEGTFVKHFTWLKQNKSVDEISTNNKGHPITGADLHYCLFDVFHEENTKKEMEILRRIIFFPELNGVINTNVAEQEFAI